MGGKILSESAFKRTEAAVRYVENLTSDGRPRPQEPSTQYVEKKCAAKVVCSGPEGEVEDPDFDNEDYWLQLGELTKSDDDPHGFEEYDEDDGRAAIVQATNEWEIDATVKHLVDMGRIVEARWNPKTQAWWFVAPAVMILAYIGSPANACGTESIINAVDRVPHRWSTLISDPADTTENPRGEVVFKGERYRVGTFTLAGGFAVLIRWDEATGKWIGIPGHTLIHGHAIALAPDGESIVFGGLASSGNGTSAIWQWDGTSMSSLGTTTDFGCWSLLYWNDGSGNGTELYAGGEGVTPSPNFHGVGRRRGGAWQELGGSGLSNAAKIVTMAVYDDGLGNDEQLCVGGYVTTAGGATCNNVARWDKTNNWRTMGDGIPPRYGKLGAVLTLCVWDRGEGPEVYGGGEENDGFLFAYGLTGPTWRAVPETLESWYFGAPAVPVLHGLAVDPSGRSLIVVGEFYYHVVPTGKAKLKRAATWDDGADTISQHGDGYDDVVWGQVHYQGKCIDLGAFQYSGRGEPMNGVSAHDKTADTVTACGSGVAGTARGGLIIGDLLHIYGGFLVAGGVTVQNIATLAADLTTYASPGYINGTVYGGCQDLSADKGWLCGRFDMAFGLSGHLCLTGWDGASTDNPITAIEPEAAAVIHDVIDIGGGYLVVTGLFESINGTPCKNIAKIQKSTGTVTALGGGINGMGTCLAHFGGDVWVGHTGQTIDGSTSSPWIAHYTLSTSTWHAVTSTSAFGWLSPVTALQVEDVGGGGDALYIGCYGNDYLGGLTSHRVRKRTSGGSYSVVAGGDGYLDDEVLSIAYGDAGEGDDLNFGGRFRVAGPALDSVLLPAMLIIRLKQNQQWESIAGGLGLNPVFDALGLGGGWARNVDIIKEDGHRCSTISVTGQVGASSRFEATGIAALTNRGLKPVQGGLLGGESGWAGAGAVLRMLDGSLEIGGDFKKAYNRWIRSEDADDIDEIVDSPNIVTFADGYYIPSGTGFSCIAVHALTLFDDVAWMCGAYFRPHFKHATTGLWTDMPGGDELGASGDFRGLITYAGELWAYGDNFPFKNYTLNAECVHGDGTTFTDASPVNMLVVEDAVIGDGVLYIAGKPDGTANPVRKRSGSSWVDVGTNLEGWIFSITYVDFPSGAVLIVCGGLTVGGVGCRVAMIEIGDTTWIKIADMGFGIGGAYDYPTTVYGTQIGELCCVCVGLFTAIADPLDGGAVTDGLNSVALWDPTNHWQGPAGGGVNAPGVFAGGGMVADG